MPDPEAEEYRLVLLSKNKPTARTATLAYEAIVEFGDVEEVAGLVVAKERKKNKALKGYELISIRILKEAVPFALSKLYLHICALAQAKSYLLYDLQAEAFVTTDMPGQLPPGYVLPSVPSPPGKRNAQLEAMIHESLDDPEPYLVYGDWLQSEGEPIGELVAIQHGLAVNPEDKDLLRAEEEFIHSHQLYLFNAPQSACTRIESSQCSDRGWQHYRTETYWRYGFIRSLAFELRLHDKEASLLLTNILSAPVCRFIQEIAIENQTYDEGTDIQALIQAIVEAPCAATLRRFAVSKPNVESYGWANFEVGQLFDCPRLECVFLEGSGVLDGIGREANKKPRSQIRAPKLKSLTLRTGHLSRDAMALLARAHWPNLEELEVWVGYNDYVGAIQCTSADYAELLSRDYGQLHRLTLMNISEEGATRLLESKEYFPNLQELRVGGNFEPELREQLRNFLGPESVQVLGHADRYDDIWE
jgi:uncharacterized protein (TIGR02996 family)